MDSFGFGFLMVAVLWNFSVADRSIWKMLQLVKSSVTYIRWANVIWGSGIVVWTVLGLGF
jgi:hypothetical protein